MDKATLISQIREIRENGFVATCIDEQHLGPAESQWASSQGMVSYGHHRLGIPTVRVTEETLGRLVEVLTKYGKRASEAIAGLPLITCKHHRFLRRTRNDSIES